MNEFMSVKDSCNTKIKDFFYYNENIVLKVSDNKSVFVSLTSNLPRRDVKPVSDVNLQIQSGYSRETGARLQLPFKL